MEGDINLNSLFNGIAMIIAFTMSAPIINKIGYSKSFLFFFTMSIISSLLYVFMKEKSRLLICMLVFTSRLGICPCYSLTFITSN